MRFTKTLTATAAALLATVALPACAQPAPQAAPAATTDADPALWVVKDADTTIYLFGTVHVLKPGLSWFDEAVKTAFDSSGELVLEMVAPEPAEAQKIVMAKAVDADGPALSQKLSEGDRAAYVKAMTDVGLPWQQIEPFKPWMASVTLSMTGLGKAGYDPNSGAEKVLTAAAEAAKKPISALETMEQQLGFFDGLPEPTQITFLNATVKDMPKLTTVMGDMISSWSKGDHEALGSLLNENMKETPEIAKVLLFDRNARWADWIGQRLAKPGTVFIAVGAGHLAGKQSVQDYLAAKKLTATRVTY
jgi:hypothetical protein